MSRGPGALQRQVIELYPRAVGWAKRYAGVNVAKQADMAMPYMIYGDAPTESQKRSVRRAVKSLRERDLITVPEVPVMELTDDERRKHEAAEHIKAVIEEFIASGEDFSADDVRESFHGDRPILGAMAVRPRLLPSLIGAASRAGRIEPVGVCRPSRASRHGNRNIVWRGA